MKRRWLEDPCEEDKKDNIFHSTGAAGNDTTRGAETDSFLSFRVDNARPNKDVAVWINGIRNKLSAKDHVYYNENKTFIYAVPLKDGEDTISVTFGKGKYQLSHVQAYLGSLPERSKTLYQSEVQVDKKLTKDNVIQGTIQVKNDGWFITSIPYDTHLRCTSMEKRRRYKR